jgi:hypothetical protein
MDTSISTYVVSHRSALWALLSWFLGLINPVWIQLGEGRGKEFLFQRLVLDEIYWLVVVPDEIFFLLVSFANIFTTLLMGWVFTLLVNLTTLSCILLMLRVFWLLDWFLFGLWSCLPGVDALVSFVEDVALCLWEGARNICSYFPPRVAWRGIKYLAKGLLVSVPLVAYELWVLPGDSYRFVRHSLFSSGLFEDKFLVGDGFLWFDTASTMTHRFRLGPMACALMCGLCSLTSVPVISLSWSIGWTEYVTVATVLVLSTVGRSVWLFAVAAHLLALDWHVSVVWVEVSQVLVCLAVLFVTLLGDTTETPENLELRRLCAPRDVIGEDGRPVPGPVPTGARRSQVRLQALARGKAWARMEGTEFVSVAGVAPATSRIRPRGRLTAAIVRSVGNAGTVGSLLRGRWTPDLPSRQRSPAVNAILASARDGLKVLGVGTEPCGDGGFKDYLLVETSSGERRLIFPELAARLHLYAALRPRDLALQQGLRARAAAWFKDEALPSWCVLCGFSSAVADAFEVGPVEELSSRRVACEQPPTPDL